MRGIATGLAAAALLASAAHAADLPNPHSWGKPGVSYLQFRTDVAECGYLAAHAPMPDLAKTAPPMPMAASLDEMESYILSYQAYELSTTSQVVNRIQAEVDKCLRGRGYAPFRLTKQQMSELGRYRKGTRARYEHIFALASDPGVLKAQGL